MRADGLGLDEVIGTGIGRLPMDGHTGKIGRLPMDEQRPQGPNTTDISFMDLWGDEPGDIETTETQLR
jgi:hypothetical protein